MHNMPCPREQTFVIVTSNMKYQYKVQNHCKVLPLLLMLWICIFSSSLKQIAFVYGQNIFPTSSSALKNK